MTPEKQYIQELGPAIVIGFRELIEQDKLPILLKGVADERGLDEKLVISELQALLAEYDQYVKAKTAQRH